MKKQTAHTDLNFDSHAEDTDQSVTITLSWDPVLVKERLFRSQPGCSFKDLIQFKSASRNAELLFEFSSADNVGAALYEIEFSLFSIDERSLHQLVNHRLKSSSLDMYIKSDPVKKVSAYMLAYTYDGSERCNGVEIMIDAENGVRNKPTNWYSTYASVDEVLKELEETLQAKYDIDHLMFNPQDMNSPESYLSILPSSRKLRQRNYRVFMN